MSHDPHTPLSSFGAAWLDQPSLAHQFSPYDARAPHWYEQVATWAPQPLDPLLVTTIKEQADMWSAPPAALSQLEKLSDPQVLTVVTGQQCGLLLGPGYTLYKALTAIAWARHAERVTGRPTVPVFWLQTEDHDAREIETAYSLDDQALTPITATLSGHERTSVAHRHITDEMSEVCSRLSHMWGELPFGAEELAYVERAWRPGRRVADAFAETLYRWLGPLGLVILDPRAPALAPLARPIHERSLFDAVEIEHVLQTRSAELTQAGFKVQIPPRPQSTLTFFHPDGAEGPRYRVMRAEVGERAEGQSSEFKLSGDGRSLSHDELQRQLEEHPERFSTSALLRPLLQERWLPTIATVVGPGELSYFGQLSPLFERFGQRAPAVIPRAKARLWTQAWRRAFRKGHITEADLSDPRDEVLRRYGQTLSSASVEELRVHALDTPLALLDRFIEELESSDRGLIPHAQRTRRTIEKSMSGLLDRQARSAALKSELYLKRLDLLRDALAPRRAPQERVLSPLYFAALIGKDQLLSALEPLLSLDAAGRLTEIDL